MGEERLTGRRKCPHCDGTGKGPQSGQWGALLTSAGVIPAECQNCLGQGVIEVRGIMDGPGPDAWEGDE